MSTERLNRLARAIRENAALKNWFKNSLFALNESTDQWWRRGGCAVVADAWRQHLGCGEVVWDGQHAVLRLPNFDLDGDGVRAERLGGNPVPPEQVRLLFSFSSEHDRGVRLAIEVLREHDDAAEKAKDELNTAAPGSRCF